MNRDEVLKFFLSSKILHESKGNMLDYLDSVFAFENFMETCKFFCDYNAMLTDEYNLILPVKTNCYYYLPGYDGLGSVMMSRLLFTSKPVIFS